MGKTTISAAVAAGLAEEGFKVLAVSSDPTPSLGRVLEAGGQGLEAYGDLSLLELGEDRVKEMWKERFGEEVYRVATSLFPVGREVIDYVAGAPGIPDEFMLYYIYEVWRKGVYDYIVWDTPAAGGSVRLLRLEKELYTHLGDAARMYLRVKGVIERLRRGEASPLELIEDWRRIAEEVLSFLASENHRLHLVTTADELGLYVSRKLVRELGEHGIRVRRVIVNMFVRGDECPGCSLLETEAEEEAGIVERITAEFGDLGVCIVPRLPSRPQGRSGLLRLYRLVKEGCISIEG